MRERDTNNWRPSTLAIALSFVLTASYLLFIALCMFAPDLMGTKIDALSGLSIAVLTGFALLALSVVAAVTYMLRANRTPIPENEAPETT